MSTSKRFLSLVYLLIFSLIFMFPVLTYGAEDSESYSTRNGFTETVEIGELNAGEDYNYVLVVDNVIYDEEIASANDEGVLLIPAPVSESYYAVFVDKALYAHNISKEDLIEKFNLIYDESTGKYDFPRWEDYSESEEATIEGESEGVEEVDETEAELSNPEEPIYTAYGKDIIGVVTSEKAYLYEEPKLTSWVMSEIPNGEEFISKGYYDNGFLDVYYKGDHGYIVSTDALPLRVATDEGKETETEIETEAETEVETEAPVLEYKENGLDVTGSLTADAETQAFDGQLTVVPDAEETGNVSADTIKSTYEIEFPEGSKVPNLRVVNNRVTTEGGDDLVWLLNENSNAVIESAEVKDTNVVVTVANEKAEEDISVSDSALVVNGNAVGIEVEDSLFKPIAETSEEKRAVKAAYPDLGEDEYLPQEEILNLPFIDLNYEAITEPNIKENEQVKVTLTQELSYEETQETLDFENVSDPIELRTFQYVGVGSDLGTDLGYITTQHATSVEFGSTFINNGKITMRGDGGSGHNYYYANNVTFDEGHAVIYRHAAMYKGKWYDVKITYKKSEATMPAYALIVDVAAGTGRSVGDIANSIRQDTFDKVGGGTVNNPNSEANFSRTDMLFEILNPPAETPTWLFSCRDCDLKEGYWFQGTQYYYGDASIGHGSLQEIAIITATGTTEAAVVGLLGNAQHGNDPCKDFYALVSGNSFYATYRTGKCEFQEGVNNTSLRKSDLYGAQITVNFGLTADSELTYNPGVTATLWGNTIGLSRTPQNIGHALTPFSKSTLPSVSVPAGYKVEPYWSTSEIYGANQLYPIGGVSSALYSDTNFWAKVSLARGNLHVTKTINDPSGFHSNDYASFSMTLSGTGIAGITLSPITVQMGKTYNVKTGAWGTCAANECHFYDVPIGGYTITESYSKYSGNINDVWVCSPSSSTGVTIYEGDGNYHTFSNKYKTGKLVIPKTMLLNGSDTSTTMRTPPKNGFKFRIYGTSLGNDVISQSANGNGTISYTGITDANGNVTFVHIPIGTSCYTITEELTDNPSTVTSNINDQADLWKFMGDLTNVSVPYNE